MTVLDLITKLTEMARDNPEAKVYIDAIIDSGPCERIYSDLVPGGLISWTNNKTKQSIIIEVEN